MSLKQKVLSGFKWTLFSKIVSQIFSWLSTFLVIRILSPEDYGIIALAMTFIVLGNVFSYGGFITSIVKHQKKDNKLASQIFSLSLFINFLIAIIVSVFSKMIGDFYHNQELPSVLIVMAFANILNSLIIVPSAYLDIDMNFKFKALCDSVGSVFAASVSLILAYQGFSYWSLVYAHIVMKLVQVVGYNRFTVSRYSITLDFNGSASALKFAIHNQLNGFLWFFYNQMDVILIGRFLGINLLGIYNVAKDIASIPFMKVAAMMNQVGFSAFASLNENKYESNYYLYKSLKLVSIFSFPVFFGISSVSEELITLLVGNKWEQAGPLIKILCFVFPFRMMNTNVQLYVNGLNQPRFNVQNTFIMSIIIIILMFWATQISLKMTAIAWVSGFSLIFCVILLRVKQRFSLTFSTIFVWIGPFLISMTMWFLLYILGQYEPFRNLTMPMQMVSKIITGFLFISLFYYFFYKKEISGLIKKS